MQPDPDWLDDRLCSLALGALLILLCANGAGLIHGMFTSFGPWPAVDASDAGRLSWLMLAPAAVACFAFYLVGHEAAHYAAGHVFGLRGGRIGMWAGAGLRPHYRAPAQAAWRIPRVRFWVFLAGPIFDQLFVAAVLSFLSITGRWANLLAPLAFAAYVLGVFNTVAVARTDVCQALQAASEMAGRAGARWPMRFLLRRWNLLLVPCHGSILIAAVLGSVVYVRWSIGFAAA